ncbi:MAG TPA: mandelate racemase/muconate lactonizing enzyme family protein [Dongiaceae bacterium]|nr:mandelate racemase/muconate lactonizing enzyme family protein [Dongiaceae bacterium]
MKITDLRATPVNIPFVAPYRFSYGSMASVTKTVVEVVTDHGVTGLGEVADGDRSAEVLRQRDKLIGLDVRDIHAAEQRIVPAMRYTPWGNILAQRRVFGGIEMAMWDARGRSEGVPLALLLGGAVRREIALTEYFSYRLPGAYHPGEATPADIARYCATMIERHEADAFEGKLATVSLDEEVAMVREVRATIGDRMLRLDANGAWTVPTAREAFRRLDPFVIHYYEDPVETYEEMAALRGATRASFCTHLIDLPKAARLRAPDAIVTNLNELGGIRRTVDFIRACEAFDIAFRFHAGETGIASAAYLQVSAAMEHVREPCQTILRWYADDVIEGGPFSPSKGVLKVPDGPGLGVLLDRKALQRCHERFLSEGAFPAGAPGQHYGGAFRKH